MVISDCIIETRPPVEQPCLSNYHTNYISIAYPPHTPTHPPPPPYIPLQSPVKTLGFLSLFVFLQDKDIAKENEMVKWFIHNLGPSLQGQ